MNYGTFIAYLHLSADGSGENVDTSRNEAFGILKSETSDNYEGYDSSFTYANKADHSRRFWPKHRVNFSTLRVLNNLVLVI